MRGRSARLTIMMLLLASCAREAPRFQARALPTAEQGAPLAQGRMLAGRGEHALAIDAFRKAVRADPENVGAYRGLAASYDAIGRFDLGGRYHELALALAPRDPALREEMAQSLERQDRREDAAMLRRELAASATAEPVARGQVVTMDIVDVPPRSMMARLERVSLAETVLVTDPRALVQHPAPSGRSASAPVPATPPARVATAPLKVMNAVGRRGQAARMRGHLLRSGWPAVETGDYAERIEQSRLIAPPALRDDARKMIAALPFRVRVYTSPQAARMILVLGANAIRFDETLRKDRRL
ncbi:LytR C-terminal domain-containing protein [Sphingomonas colocasiae]|uniref:LytR C-terminal domain-containing protein n=1 Tax=Sphingomonas colocasiae TaxID=1848973 RepID=A0ABS7PYN4_9SPHN|nr:LytR C-terminal domain-containing protein [Sphingomonas colocasiae]MBY8826482.1 LytR C-terminal domain-containing protein [Sphingomonas colocasiae]